MLFVEFRFFWFFLAVFAVYWSLFGWKFALGFVLSIYIHEMGHVIALRKYGIAATSPMFIPFVGAIVRLRQYPANVAQDARVGLAGPIWGLGAAVVAWSGDIYYGLWYPIGVAVMTLIIGTIFLRETKDVDITK